MRIIPLWLAIAFVFILPGFILGAAAGWITLTAVPQVYTLLYVFVTLMAAVKWFGKGTLKTVQSAFGTIAQASANSNDNSDESE
jgi:hypothetical protein